MRRKGFSNGYEGEDFFYREGNATAERTGV